jgi:hypothetical protein
MYAEIKPCVRMNRRETLQCPVANVRQKLNAISTNGIAERAFALYHGNHSIHIEG